MRILSSLTDRIAKLSEADKASDMRSKKADETVTSSTQRLIDINSRPKLPEICEVRNGVTVCR